MNPLVIAVKANPDFTLSLTFENGQERIFDMKPYLSIGVFKQLQDYALFKKVKPFYGSISWATEQDLSHDTLYMGSKKIHHPKEKESLHAVAEPSAKYKKRR